MKEVRVTNIVPGVWGLWLEGYLRVSRLNKYLSEARVAVYRVIAWSLSFSEIIAMCNNSQIGFSLSFLALVLDST